MLHKNLAKETLSGSPGAADEEIMTLTEFFIREFLLV